MQQGLANSNQMCGEMSCALSGTVAASCVTFPVVGCQMQVAVCLGVWCAGCWALGGAAVSAFRGCWAWLAVSGQPVFRWQVAWCLESGTRGIALQGGCACGYAWLQDCALWWLAVVKGGVLQMNCAVCCHLQDRGAYREALPQEVWRS